VLAADWDVETHTVFGVVKGSYDPIYEQEIHLSVGNGKLLIDGSCTCPVGKNCKHVVAAMLTLARTDPWLQVDEALQTPLFDLAAPEHPAPKPNVAPEVERWLSNVEERLRPEPPEPETDDEVRYVIRVIHPDHPDRYAVLDLLTTRPSKTGSPHKKHHVSMNAIRSNNFPRFYRRSDLALVKSIARNLTVAEYEVASFRLEGAEGVRHLDAVLATGRCRWATLDGPTLHPGEPRKIVAHWEANRNGKQTLRLSVEPAATLLPMSPPFYVDPRTGDCGPADAGLPADAVLSLLRAPEILPEHSGAVRAEMARLLPDRPELLPSEQNARIETDIPPTPHLKIARKNIQYERRLGRREGLGSFDVPVATLRFEYDGIGVVGTADIRKKQPDGSLRIIQRHLAEEDFAERTLRRSGWSPGRYNFGWRFDKETEKAYVMVPEDPDRGTPSHLQAYYAFLTERVPELRRFGWIVEIEREPVRVPSEAIEWNVEARPEGNDWFDFELGLVVEGQRVNLRPVLLQALNVLLGSGRYKRLEEAPDTGGVFHELPDGRLVAIPLSRLKPLVRSLVELFGPISDWTDELRLPSGRAAELQELDETAASGAFSLQIPDRLRELTQRLASFERIEPVATPEGFAGELRPYQAEGLAWLQFLRAYGFGGILADDMGLGKTVQTLAHILTEKIAGRLDRPVLIVAPTSTLPNWWREAERFAPSLKVLTLQGTTRAKRFGEIADHDIVLSTYPLLTRDREALSAQEFHLVVLDEAQNIKNPVISAAKAACALKTRHRVCLSGTPVENHLDELWSLMHFLMPGMLGTISDFRRRFRHPIENNDDKDARARLTRRIRPFTLRRTKEQVATELPPKTEVVERVELSGAQRDLYESLRLAMDQRVRDLISRQGFQRSRIEILDALLKLRQVCCDPRLVKLDSAKEVKGSAKLDRLMEMLDELHSEGRRVLLFSQFTSMLDLIEARLREVGREWVRISGDTQDRDTPVRRFQAGEVPLFLISLRAGGTGLNLTAADTVIHYDPWWNPAVERQATDRAHRIGQDKSVFVFKLVAEGTVEDKILELQERKAQLAASLFDENADSAAALTAEELKWVFE
jgi:superfamily II DNA or RNA helicase